MPFFKSVHDARADELGDSAAPSRFPTDKSVGGDASSSIGSTREPHLLARTKHVYYRDQPHGYRRSCCGGPRRRRASRWCVPRPRPRSAHRRIAAVALTFAPIVFLRPSDGNRAPSRATSSRPPESAFRVVRVDERGGAPATAGLPRTPPRRDAATFSMSADCFPIFGSAGGRATRPHSRPVTTRDQTADATSSMF